METLKSLLRGVLVLQLAFSPSLLLAKGKAKALTPAQKKAVTDSMTRAVFDLIVQQSAMVESAKDFEKLMLVGLKPADRKAVMSNLKSQKFFPTFQRKGNILVLDTGLRKYEVTWQNFGTYDFEFNGVKWTYQPAEAFMPQYFKLEKQIKEKKTAGFWRNLILPEAEALAPILLMVVGAVVGVIASDMAGVVWCKGVEYVGSTTEKCTNVKKAEEEALYKDVPSLDAVANQAGSDNSNVLAKYEGEDWKCPTSTDDSAKEYRGRLRTVETKDGTTTPTSGWFEVIAKFTAEGLPTDIIISREGADPSKLDTSSQSETRKLVVHIAFDPTKKKPVSYRLPNPDYDPNRDLLGNPTVTLTSTMKLSPEQSKAIENAKDIVKFINYRNYNCVAKKAEENQQAGIQSVTPGGATTTK